MARCYLIHVGLAGKPSGDRLTAVALKISELAKAVSSDQTLAYQSQDGTTFGLLITSSLSSKEIAKRIAAPDVDTFVERLTPTTLGDKDTFLVVEVSNAFAIGPTRAATWIQNRRQERTQEARSSFASDEPKAPSKLASQLAEKLGTRNKRD